jgi:anti-sigma-K factor RskA
VRLLGISKTLAREKRSPKSNDRSERMWRRQTALAVSLATLALGACATPTALTTKVALEAFKTIPNSKSAPCVMQRAVAAHNSTYDTLKTGKETVYKAPSDKCKASS